MSVLFFFKNGYPSKERASKDTQLQVTKLELGKYMSVYLLILTWHILSF